MAEKDTYQLQKRLENIESLLNLLLINAISNENEIEKIQEDTVKKLEEIITPLNLFHIRLNYIEKHYYVFAEIDSSASLNEIRSTYAKATSIIKEMKFVLVFEKLYSRRKKALDDSKISYYVKNGELKIY